MEPVVDQIDHANQPALVEVDVVVLQEPRRATRQLLHQLVELGNQAGGGGLLGGLDEVVAPAGPQHALDDALAQEHQAAALVDVRRHGRYRCAGHGVALGAAQQTPVLLEPTVVVGQELQVLGDALVARDTDQRGQGRLDDVGIGCLGARREGFGIGLHVEQEPLDLAVGRPREDRLGRVAEGLVVEQAAVQEARLLAEVAPQLQLRVDRAVAGLDVGHRDRLEGDGEAGGDASKAGERLDGQARARRGALSRLYAKRLLTAR